MSVTDKVGPIKEGLVKQKSRGWFDGGGGGIVDEIKIMTNCLKSLKDQSYVFTKI